MGALGLGLSARNQTRPVRARTQADFLRRAYRLNGRWVTEAEFFQAGTVSGAGGSIRRGGRLTPADAPRVGDTGLLIEDPRTNWVTAYAAPVDLARVSLRLAGGSGPATLTLEEDGAALEAAGLDAITGGRAYKLDNRMGTTPARLQIQGASPDDQPLALSAYVRGGAGRLRTAYTDLQTGGFTATDGYRRVTALQSDGLAAGARAVNDLMWVEAAPGEAVWVACPQMETGNWASSYIPTHGAAGVRTRDQISFPRAALGLDLDEGSLRVELGEHRRGRVAARIIGTDGPHGASLLNFVGNSDTQIGTYNGESVLISYTTLDTVREPFVCMLSWGLHGQKLSVGDGVSSESSEPVAIFSRIYIAQNKDGDSGAFNMIVRNFDIK